MYLNDDFTTSCACGARVGAVPANSGESVDIGCGSATAQRRWGLTGYPLSMVYSPMQEWRSLYDSETALMQGTLFAELDLPFMGGRGGCGCGGVGNGR